MAMGKMITYIVIGIVVILALIGGYFWYNQQMKPEAKITEYRDFSCPGMTGFTFKYPVFTGMKYGGIQSDKNSCFIILDPTYRPLSTSDSDGPTRKLSGFKVKKIDKYDLYKIKDMSYQIPGLATTKNAQGIIYQRDMSVDPNSIIFFSDDFGVEIKLDIYNSINDTFVENQFFQTVIDSFKLSLDIISKEQAIQLVREKLLLRSFFYDTSELGLYGIEAEAISDGWRVYLVKKGNDNPAEGTPEYVVNTKTGKVSSDY